MQLAQKIFVAGTIFLTISSALASNLNHITLSTLRGLHGIDMYSGGSSKVLLNSSERFFDLYETLGDEELSEINDSVDSAYNAPYKTIFKLSQGIKVQNFLIGFEASDGLVGVINNPVFPEIELFNVRTNSVYLQNSFQYKSANITTKLSLMNRWYISEVYTLENLVERDLELELESGETYTPIYLDAVVTKPLDLVDLQLNITGVNLFNTDPYNYYEIKTSAFYHLNNEVKLGLGLSPLYAGEYLILDTVAGLASYNSEVLGVNASLSKLKQTLELKLNWRHFASVLGVEKDFVSIDSELYTENTYLEFQLKY